LVRVPGELDEHDLRTTILNQDGARLMSDEDQALRQAFTAIRARLSRSSWNFATTVAV
jgi:hypothetical protein